MVLLALLFFVSSFLIGTIVVNHFLQVLSKFAKVSASFFLGTYISTIVVFLIASILKNVSDPLLFALLITLFMQYLFIGLTILKKRSLFMTQLSKFEAILLLIFFSFGWYIMQKSFGYEGGNFQIASNLYLDFGAHIPIIRSFSQGNNFSPTFPFYAGVPLIYHFFYDFAVALYEKLGLRIDLAFNFLSALSFAGVLSLIFSLSYEMFSKRVVGIIAVLLFVFNSSLSFVYALEKYFGLQIVSKLYHHNIYLGDGPFGNNLVSIFWNLNTDLNQRHFLFSLGLLLIISHMFYFLLSKKKLAFPWLFLACLVGLLPFWNSSTFLAAVCIGIATTVILFITKRPWKQMFLFCVAAILIATPQVLLMKSFQSVEFSTINPGFLVAQQLSLKNLFTYWFWNLGLCIIFIPIGIWLAKGKRQFFIPIVVLFLLPNIFQFSPQMFDNHKFFNIFILFTNIYVAYVLYLLFKKQFLLKILACVLFFFLTFSGVIDFLVVKNDIKTTIVDYPNSKFLSWVRENTDPHAVFLTNAEIYDPITFIGRQSFIGRPHYLWVYGISPEERLKIKQAIFDESYNNLEIGRQKIDYIVMYKNLGPIHQFPFCISVFQNKEANICKMQKNLTLTIEVNK